jgi:hypothetical protein
MPGRFKPLPFGASAPINGGGLGAAAAPSVRATQFHLVRVGPSFEVAHDACGELEAVEAAELAELGPLAPTDGAHEFASRLGLNPLDLARETRARERGRVADAMQGLKTRGGVERSRYVATCGRLHIGKSQGSAGERYGVAHWRCKDRLCPTCGELRSRKQAWRLRQFIEQRACWDRLLFPTLTHRKRPVAEETASEAITRLGKDLLRVFDTKFASGRELATVIDGALFVIELTWSPKGWRTSAATGRKFYVEFSGWHAHVHALVEVAEGVDLGYAAHVILKHWIATADAEPAAQYVKPATPQNVGQLCKYVLKPMSISNPRRLRQAAHAISNIKAERARGEWKGWKKKVADDGKWDHVEVSGYTLGDLQVAAKQDKWISWHDTVGDHVRTIGVVEATALVRTLARAPETLNEAVKRRRSAEREIPWWKQGKPTAVSIAWVIGRDDDD